MEATSLYFFNYSLNNFFSKQILNTYGVGTNTRFLNLTHFLLFDII